MLARIAYELFWLGRYVQRGEQTARMMAGMFELDVQGRPEGAATPKTLSWEALLAIMGAMPDEDSGPLSREDVIRTLTIDADNPASIYSCVQSAREGARTVRDVISTEMWEAVNTFHLQLREESAAGLPTGPYAVCSFVKERAALFWGLASTTMLRDDAYAFLMAGGNLEACDMLLRMLRVALPDGLDGDRSDPGLVGPALALLNAVGGMQAFRRSTTGAVPNAATVGRFLLFEPAYPNSVAATLNAVRETLIEADDNYRNSPPLLRLNRLAADLEFRRRVTGNRQIPATITDLQQELVEVDAEIADRYFAGAATSRVHAL
jgi:uncharacterized alpha-E superfamily protein